MFPLYGLALHTGSRDLGLAISNFQTDRRSQSWDLDRDLSNYLHLYLEDFIKPQTWQDIAFLAVTQGPGSFTSLRIGLVTVRTLAQQLNLPVFSFSSLEVLAHSQGDKFIESSYLALQMPATRGQVYGAIYQVLASGQAPRQILSDRLFTLEDWQTTLENLSFNYLLLQTPIHLGNTVTSLLELAFFAYKSGKMPPWSEAVPFYG